MRGRPRLAALATLLYVAPASSSVPSPPSPPEGCDLNQCRPGGTYDGTYTFTTTVGDPAGCTETYCDQYLPGGPFHSRCSATPGTDDRGYADEECAATCQGQCDVDADQELYGYTALECAQMCEHLAGCEAFGHGVTNSQADSFISCCSGQTSGDDGICGQGKCVFQRQKYCVSGDDTYTWYAMGTADAFSFEYKTSEGSEQIWMTEDPTAGVSHDAFGEWNHFLAVRDPGGGHQIYINGQATESDVDEGAPSVAYNAAGEAYTWSLNEGVFGGSVNGGSTTGVGAQRGTCTPSSASLLPLGLASSTGPTNGGNGPDLAIDGDLTTYMMLMLLETQ